MAQRLATEYVQTCLQLSEAELSAIVSQMSIHALALKNKVYENGNQELVLQDQESGEEISFRFEWKDGNYVMTGTCKLYNLVLANMMRRFVAEHQGDAVVNRIYDGYTMTYVYAKGKIVRITEIKGGSSRIVFEVKDTLGQLEMLYRSTLVEAEIAWVRKEINELLDARLYASNSHEIEHIDSSLAKLNKRLFIMEA